MKQKRVEYQKFVRIKLEQPRYRGLFGLTENIEMVGEEDFVLQREFLIDFVLQKINPTVLIRGIFSHFKRYNLLEFKSVNDLLTQKAKKASHPLGAGMNWLNFSKKNLTYYTL